MKGLFKFFKFLLALFVVLLLLMYCFFDDLKRYSLKTAINIATENGKYLLQPYNIKIKEGVIYLSNLEIKTPDVYLNIEKSAINVPFLFLFNNAIKISLDNFIAKTGAGQNMMLSGAAGIDFRYGGTLSINTPGIDLELNKKKLLKFVGNFDSNRAFNVINIYDYLDNNNKGQMVFGISKFTKVHFKTISVPYAGGIITAEPFDIDISNPKLKLLNVDINNIKLSAILQLDTFAVDSRFSGKISVNPDEKKIIYINLKTTEPGRVKFKSNELLDFVDKIDQNPIIGAALGLMGKNNPIAPIHKAMNNLFEFSSLQIETQKNDQGRDNIKISLYGMDQKLYDGKPMNINVNLDLDLNKIINSYLNAK